MPSNARISFGQQETTWFGEDCAILEFKATKNELESFTYEMKNNIDSYGPYEKYIEEAARVDFLKKLNDTVAWIYGEGQSAPTQQYKQRLEEFRKLGVPIKNRCLFHSEIEVYFTQFKNFGQEINDKLAAANSLSD